MKYVAFSALLCSAMLAITTRGDASQVKPAFERLDIKIEPFPVLSVFAQVEELQIEATGRCWYKVAGRDGRRNVPARSGAVFDHQLSGDDIQQLNNLLEDTRWLTAKGGEGRATHTHPTTVTVTITRAGKQHTVVCQGQRPAPYAALLHAIHGLATQERRIYLHDYVSGEAGAEAWAEIGRELAALRGDPYGKPPFQIDYGRYLPIARRILRPFYTGDDGELVPAVRLVGHFKVKGELRFLHRMAYDRSSNLRTEVAWALGQIHEQESLPILADMMAAPANVEAAGLQLIRWGDEAVPHIVELIQMSTDAKREHWESTIGEDMIRAYLAHWEKLDRKVDPRVAEAVRVTLEKADPQNGLIRTDYHKEFLQRMETGPPKGKE
jgi:hypothetical protein